MTPSEQHEEKERLKRKALFIQSAFEHAIQGGGIDAYIRRLKLVGVENDSELDVVREQWAHTVEHDALAAFEVIERYRRAAK